MKTVVGMVLTRDGHSYQRYWHQPEPETVGPYNYRARSPEIRSRAFAVDASQVREVQATWMGIDLEHDRERVVGHVEALELDRNGALWMAGSVHDDAVDPDAGAVVPVALGALARRRQRRRARGGRAHRGAGADPLGAGLLPPGPARAPRLARGDRGAPARLLDRASSTAAGAGSRRSSCTTSTSTAPSAGRGGDRAAGEDRAAALRPAGPGALGQVAHPPETRISRVAGRRRSGRPECRGAWRVARPPPRHVDVPR
jgi:hypothetical protein